MTRILSALAALCVAFAGAGRPAGAWQVEIDSVDSQDDEARALALDGRGYVFAGGSLQVAGEKWVVVKLAPGDGRELWRSIPVGDSPFPFGERLNDLTVDPSGDAIAVGNMKGDDDDFAVVKLRGSDGQELWKTILDDPGTATRERGAVAVTDGTGDVIAAGIAQPGDWSNSASWLVVKLRGSDGAVLWTQRVDGAAGSFGYPYDVAMTPDGEVIVVGMITNATTYTDFSAVKLAGADGSVLWRTDLDGSGVPSHEYAERVVVDAAGDVYAAGVLAGSYSGSAASRFAVAKLSGGDGSLIWRGDLCCGTDLGVAHAIALSADGGVIAGGASERQDIPFPFTVARFNASTGLREWRVVIPGLTGYGRANAVAVDARGDVWAAGMIETNAAGQTDAFLVKIHPCGVDEPCVELPFSYDAEVVLQRRSDGTSTGERDYDEHFELRMGDENAPVLAGVRYQNHPEVGSEEPHLDFAVERVSESGRGYSGPNPFIPACADGADNDGDGLLDLVDPGCDDAADLFEQAGAALTRPISGRRLLAKDRFGNAAARKLSLQSADPSLFIPAPGSASDPRLHGAVLEVVNTISGERSFAALPAAGWIGVGVPPGSAGYRYSDSKRTAGPCRTVDLRPARLKASCKGSAIGFSLNEPSQGRVSGRLHLASGDRLCTEFGGDILDDTSTSQGGAGLFRADDAPAPSQCAP